MKALILSDTHVRRFSKLPEFLIKSLDSVDVVIHAGDYTSAEVVDEFESNFEFYGVHGNSDDKEVKEILPSYRIFEVGGVRIYLTHSGRFGYDYFDLFYSGREFNARIVIFGHLHTFINEEYGDVRLLCPGSPTKPRFSYPGFVVADFHDGKIKINRIEKR